MARNVLRCWLASLLLGSACALALEVGEIQVDSSLNQLFDATIPLPMLSPEELGRISVKVASPTMFKEFGLDRGATLDNLVFSIQYDAEGKVYVKVVSIKPIHEPSLALLLEFGWPRGKTFREFTVLLDPVRRLVERPVGRSKTVLDTPTDAGTESNSEPPSADIVVNRTIQYPDRSGSSPEASSAESWVYRPGDVYGPVVSGEGLWGIALKVRPDPGITRDQMMQALFQANPEAFTKAGIDGLRSGVLLRIPTFREIADFTGSSVAKQLAAAAEQATTEQATAEQATAEQATAEQATAEQATKQAASAVDGSGSDMASVGEKPTKVTEPLAGADVGHLAVFPLPRPAALEPAPPVAEPAEVAAAEPKPETVNPEPAEVTAAEPKPEVPEPAEVAAAEPKPEVPTPEPVAVIVPEPQPEVPEPAEVTAAEPKPEVPEPAMIAAAEPKPEVPEPAVIAAAEPKPETVTPEPVAVIVPEPKPEVPEPEVIAVAEPKPETVTPEPVAVIVPEPKPEVPEPAVIAVAEPKPEVPEPAVIAAAEPKPEVPEPAVIAAAEPKPEVPEPAVIAAAEPKPEVPEPAVIAAAEPKPEVPEPAVIAAAEPKPEVPTPEPVVVAVPEPKPEVPEPAVIAAAEPKPETVTPEPVAVIVPEPKPEVPISEPVAVTVSEPKPETVTPEPKPEVPISEPVAAVAAEPKPEVPISEPVRATVSKPAPEVAEPDPALSAAAPEPVKPMVVGPVSATPLLFLVVSEVMASATAQLPHAPISPQTPSDARADAQIVDTVTPKPVLEPRIDAASPDLGRQITVEPDTVPQATDDLPTAMAADSAEPPVAESTVSEPSPAADSAEPPVAESTVSEPSPAADSAEPPVAESTIPPVVVESGEAVHAADAAEPSVMEAAEAVQVAEVAEAVDSTVVEPAKPARPAYKGGEQYGPVAPNERLWNIAAKVRPAPDIGIDTMMKALFAINPTAFSKAGMDYLKVGVTLRVPTLREIAEHTHSKVAKQLLEQQAVANKTAGPAGSSQSPLPSPPPAAASGPGADPEPKPASPPSAVN